MATHSSLLAWEITWTEEPVATVHEVTRVGHKIATKQQHAISVFSGILTPRMGNTIKGD